jgi:hypothetical protein
MTRSITDPPAANRGSRRWLQVLVNSRPEMLNDGIGQRLPDLPEDVDWRSPLLEDHYAEYRDQSFLDRLAGSPYYRAPIHAQTDLAEFWPRFGPQWDALAVTDRGQILLVEAKAHIPEMVTAPSQARGESAVQKIQASLERVKAFVNSKAPIDWSTSFYQYANRLAHLYWMRELNGHDAYLVNLFLINDREMNGPGSAAEWQAAIRLQEVFLGVRQGFQVGYTLDPWVGAYVLDVFIDVSEIPVLYPQPI